MRPYGVVYIVDDGQYTPQSVHLRVVLVELGRCKNQGRHEEYGEAKRRDERVRCRIDMLQALQVGDVRGHLVGKVVKLR